MADETLYPPSARAHRRSGPARAVRAAGVRSGVRM